LYSFLRLAIINYNFGGLKQLKFILHSSGGWRSKISVNRAVFPLDALRENPSIPCCLHSDIIHMAYFSHMNFQRFINYYQIYYLFNYLFFLYCCAGWGTLWHLHRFLQCFNYIILEFTSCTAVLDSPPLVPGIIFEFTYMCTHYLHHIHSPIPFPHHLPTSYWCQLLPTSPVGMVLASCSPIL
jgi:hypothetical protein